MSPPESRLGSVLHGGDRHYREIRGPRQAASNDEAEAGFNVNRSVREGQEMVSLRPWIVLASYDCRAAMKILRFVTVIAAGCLTSVTPASGDFTTIVNSPPDYIPLDAVFETDTQINIHPGRTARVGETLSLGDVDSPAENMELNLVGGSVWAVHAYAGSQVNVEAGSLSSAGSLLGGARGSMSGGYARAWTLFANSYLEMSGGSAGRVMTAGIDTGPSPDASLLVVTGGQIDVLDATGNVVVEGGNIGDDFVFRGGGYVDISGGSIGDNLQVGYTVIGAIPNSDEPIVVGSGGRVTISGGSIGDNMVLYGLRSLTFSGGSIGQGFQALEDSQVNIVGSQFFVDGMELENPGVGQSIVLTERNVTITGRLADGQRFQFHLYDEIGQGDFFSPVASVSVTFVPEPNSVVLVLLLGVFLVAARQWPIGKRS